MPPNGHFPLHLSSCGGGAPEPGGEGGGGERKGTLTCSSYSGCRGQVAARGQAGPGSAGGAAAGLSGGGGEGRAHTRPRNAPRRRPAVASAPPLHLGFPLPRVPGLRFQPPPATPSTHPFSPYRHHPKLHSLRGVFSARSADARSPSCPRTRTLKTFILSLERSEVYLGERG